MDNEEGSQKIKCDCCGSETLAEIRGDKVVIIDRRHGRKHTAVLTMRQLLHEMKHLATSAFSVFTVFGGHMSITDSRKIKCDCCGSETMAEVKDDRVVIIDRRHGRRHIAVLTLRELIDRMRHAGAQSKK